MILQGAFEKSQGIRYEFDRFQQEIGEGGMGVVYKGVMIDDNTNAVLRDVAIKEVKAEGSRDEIDAIIQKAQREASIRLHNDNLVEMLGFIEVEENKLRLIKKRYFIVSEFLTGVTLVDVLDGNYLDYSGHIVDYAMRLGEDLKTNRDETAYHIIKNILYGITALHDNGYIHRDIDPSNIMITDDGRIKLIDFGIAKKLDELNASDETQCDGAFIGKVEYASPELINSSIHDQDYTTDIYAIGVLFYKLLTGRLPFEGNRYDIMNAHLKKSVNTGFISNKKYAEIIRKAMSKKREQRFRTSSEMRVALDQQIPEPKKKWWLLVCPLVLIPVLIISFWPKPDENEHEEIIEEHTEIHENDNPEKIQTDYSQLDKEQLWAAINDEPDNPEILFAIALKYNDARLDNAAQMYWKNCLIPEGYAERNIAVQSKRDITSKRFVYLTLAKALDNAENSELKKRISEHLNTMIKENPEYYKYTPNPKP